VYTDTLWPDFLGAHFYSAVAEYQTRKRRKGGKAVTES
jgi:undecaprenyl pyrophosphate synthase